MYAIDTSSFIANIRTILQLVGGGLCLDPDAFLTSFEGGPGATGVLVLTLLIAGLSLMIGQSVGLFDNRVNTTRFAISLVFGGLKFFLDVLIVVVWWMSTSNQNTPSNSVKSGAPWR
jgi:hypothetical protein